MEVDLVAERAAFLARQAVPLRTFQVHLQPEEFAAAVAAGIRRPDPEDSMERINRAAVLAGEPRTHRVNTVK